MNFLEIDISYIVNTIRELLIFIPVILTIKENKNNKDMTTRRERPVIEVNFKPTFGKYSLFKGEGVGWQGIKDISEWDYYDKIDQLYEENKCKCVSIQEINGIKHFLINTLPRDIAKSSKKQRKIVMAINFAYIVLEFPESPVDEIRIEDAYFILVSGDLLHGKMNFNATYPVRGEKRIEIPISYIGMSSQVRVLNLEKINYFRKISKRKDRRKTNLIEEVFEFSEAFCLFRAKDMNGKFYAYSLSLEVNSSGLQSTVYHHAGKNFKARLNKALQKQRQENKKNCKKNRCI